MRLSRLNWNARDRRLETRRPPSAFRHLERIDPFWQPRRAWIVCGRARDAGVAPRGTAPVSSGEGIHWPDLDEDISVERLLAGRGSRLRAGKSRIGRPVESIYIPHAIRKLCAVARSRRTPVAHRPGILGYLGP